MFDLFNFGSRKFNIEFYDFYVSLSPVCDDPYCLDGVTKLDVIFWGSSDLTVEFFLETFSVLGCYVLINDRKGDIVLEIVGISLEINGFESYKLP